MYSEKVVTKELKIRLLQIIQKGKISKDDLDFMRQQMGFDPIKIEVIDKREQVDPEYHLIR